MMGFEFECVRKQENENCASERKREEEKKNMRFSPFFSIEKGYVHEHLLFWQENPSGLVVLKEWELHHNTAIIYICIRKIVEQIWEACCVIFDHAKRRGEFSSSCFLQLYFIFVCSCVYLIEKCQHIFSLQKQCSNIISIKHSNRGSWGA